MPPSEPRVLVVDDDEMQRESLAALLVADGIAVTSCERAADALAMLRALDPVDLIVSDIVMPDMDGLEFSARARALRPGMPIVLVTGDDTAVDRVIANGSVALLKPYSPGMLKRVLDEHLGRS